MSPKNAVTHNVKLCRSLIKSYWFHLGNTKKGTERVYMTNVFHVYETTFFGCPLRMRFLTRWSYEQKVLISLGGYEEECTEIVYMINVNTGNQSRNILWMSFNNSVFHNLKLLRSLSRSYWFQLGEEYRKSVGIWYNWCSFHRISDKMDLWAEITHFS